MILFNLLIKIKTSLMIVRGDLQLYRMLEDELHQEDAVQEVEEEPEVGCPCCSCCCCCSCCSCWQSCLNCLSCLNCPSCSIALHLFIGLLLHVVFKGITIFLLVIKNLITNKFTGLVSKQLILLFAVCEFWFTKNIAGKKLISLHWYFDIDQYGCKVNPDKQNNGKKLFWIVQFLYVILPIALITISIISTTFARIDFQLVFLSFGVLVGAVTNFFYFFQASKGKDKAQYNLKRKLGIDVIRRLKNASVVTYM